MKDILSLTGEYRYIDRYISVGYALYYIGREIDI